MKNVDFFANTRADNLTAGFAFNNPYKAGKLVTIKLSEDGVKTFAKVSEALGQAHAEQFLCDGMHIAVKKAVKEANKYWMTKCMYVGIIAGVIGYVVGNTNIELERNKAIVNKNAKEVPEDEATEFDS